MHHSLVCTRAGMHHSLVCISAGMHHSLVRTRAGMYHSLVCISAGMHHSLVCTRAGMHHSLLCISAGMHTLEKRKIAWSCRNSNPGWSSPQWVTITPGTSTLSKLYLRDFMNCLPSAMPRNITESPTPSFAPGTFFQNSQQTFLDHSKWLSKHAPFTGILVRGELTWRQTKPSDILPGCW